MKTLQSVLRIIFAGILAIVFLSLILCCYSITPVHIENKNRTTDYIWPSNSIWIKMTEGIAWGKFDSNGFNNKTVVENPDILVLGSSHMEATNVMQKETTAFLLGDMLKNKYTTYNMGISGHNFYKICQYISESLEYYSDTPNVIILETSTVNIQREKVDQVLTKTVEYTPSHSTGLIGTLQKIPFLRVLYQQIENGLIDLFMPSTSGNNTSKGLTADEDILVSNQGNNDVDKEAYEKLFAYLSQIEEKYGTQVIIFYHPTGTINKDGTIEFRSGKSLKTFGEYAKIYNISFVHMTSSFEEMYYKENHVAHGFVTGELEKGHLNKYGHKAIAEAIYNEILKMEANEELCQ